MTLQDHNTINELIKFYLEQHKDSVWNRDGAINREAIHKLLISNAIDSQKKDLNIY